MYKILLWLLKLGTLLNLYFLGRTINPPLVFADPHLLIPAQTLFIVSAFRCFFPVSYSTNAVLHDYFLSSVFLTRLLATFAEVAYIYQFSYLIRLFNADQIPLLDLLSWLMILQVVISQFFVWGAILTQRQKLYFYEEVGWGVIFVIYTILSGILYWELDNLGGHKMLLQLNLLFGALYLPWQWIHLKSLRLKAKNKEENKEILTGIACSMLVGGIYRSIQLRNPTTQPEAWGGIMGMTWMISYWATLIPAWLYLIVLSV